MRQIYRDILKQQFRRRLLHTRAKLELTQAEMAEKLAMDERSYIDLEHGKTCCSAITLAIFLIFLCDDVPKFLEELRSAIELQLHQPV